MNKWLILFCLLPLCGCEPSSKEGSIPFVTVCDLYANPTRFNNQEIELTGRIIVEFEYQSLACLDKEKEKQSGLWGIWITADLDSIQKRSPKFYQQIKEGFDLAHAWKGGLRGNLHCRGHFKLADSFVESGTEAQPLSGVGHFGMFEGEFVVEEVLDYQPDYLNKFDMFAGANKACLFFGIPPCAQSDLYFSAVYDHATKLFPEKTKWQDVTDAIGKLREKYEKTGNKVIVENTATKIILKFPVRYAFFTDGHYDDFTDEYVMYFDFSDAGELSSIHHLTQSFPGVEMSKPPASKPSPNESKNP